MKYAKRVIPAILAIVVLYAAILACSIEETEKKTHLFDHYYSIEPTSVLGAIDAGRRDAFVPIPESPAQLPVNQEVSVDWTQDDYLHIASALFGFARGDSLAGWQLNSMDFSLRCSEHGVGYQNGNFTFFRNVRTKGGEERVVRIVNIDPRRKYVYLTENQFYPKRVDWESIDVGQKALTAGDVLQIAEDAGGRASRFSAGNACQISMWLSPDAASYRGWEVNYIRNDDGTSLFRIQIDPHTGANLSP